MNSVAEEWLEAVDPEVLRRRRERIALILGGVLLFLLAGLLSYSLRPTKPPKDDVLLAAQYGVRRELEVHGSLHFNSSTDAQVQALSEQEFLVRGWVQDVAPDGRVWLYLYHATVDIDSNRGEYHVHDISVLPQY
jgi:hypothetical protein